MKYLTRRAIPIALAAVGLTGCAQDYNKHSQEQQHFSCRAYHARAEAQRAWQNAGEPAWADRDNDGIVCEAQFSSHHARTGRHCRRQRTPVGVYLSNRRYPKTTQHVNDAIRRGEPTILHIDRDGADGNREESLAGIPTKRGYDRDEYPPAMSAEGGTGADVRYVPSSDNRGAGFTMGRQLRTFCDGQAFRLTSQRQ